MSANNNSDKRVLVIGAAGQDVIGHLEAEMQSGISNPVHVRTSYGGVARNVAENLARLGQPVSLMSVVGTDRNGEDMLAYTSAAGVDVSAVLRSDAYPTGFYMGTLNPHGHLEFAVYDMRLMTQLTPDYLKKHEALFDSASMVFVDANLTEAALQTVIDMAHKRNIPICGDPTSSLLALRLLPHLPKFYLLTPNSVETGILIGRTFDSSDRDMAMEAARHLVSLNISIAIVTLDEFGVCYATPETSGHTPAIRTPIIDPTGAGDALTAAVIFALLNDIDIDEAVRLGVSAASLTLRHSGSVYPELSLEKLYDQLLI